jgi:orotidine-5'-phosphate decarboxylase
MEQSDKMKDYYSKIIVALDNYSVPMAREVISHWSPKVYGFKMNHILYPYIGKEYNNIFCDYKLFDIPNTMCTVVEHLIDTGAEMVTVHMNNNKSAIESLSIYANEIKLLGVTLLTSWEYKDIDKIYHSSMYSNYIRSVNLMEENGFWGMICSPQDIEEMPKTNLKKICPGIRPNPMGDDQIRTATPEEAFAAGADYLVMGRSFFANM